MSEKTSLSPSSSLAPWHWGWAAAIAAIVVVLGAYAVYELATGALSL